MSKVIYIDTFSGISGDMLLGALIDAGFDVEELRSEVDRFGIGAELHVERVKRASIDAVNFTVSCSRKQEKSRDYDTIRDMLEGKMSPSYGRDIALKMFAVLAEAEAEVHGIDVGKVHFHEVGAVDSIVDIVGIGLGIASIAGSKEGAKIFSGPVPLGSGFVETRHGKLPVPAPATMELLKEIPVKGADVAGELVTPTGAAALKAVVEDFGGMPEMIARKVGYGAGDKTFQNPSGGSTPPNLLRLIVGDEVDSRPDSQYQQDEVLILTTNIDDMNPQFYEVVMERLFEEGALDVTLTPLIMKKGRPATELTVIAEPEEGVKMAGIILSESTSTGVRYRKEKRFKLRRWSEAVETSLGPVSVKFTEDGDKKILGASPEYEDIKAIAKRSGIPIDEIYRQVKADIEKIKVGKTATNGEDI